MCLDQFVRHRGFGSSPTELNVAWVDLQTERTVSMLTTSSFTALYGLATNCSARFRMCRIWAANVLPKISIGRWCTGRLREWQAGCCKQKFTTYTKAIYRQDALRHLLVHLTRHSHPLPIWPIHHHHLPLLQMLNTDIKNTGPLYLQSHTSTSWYLHQRTCRKTVSFPCDTGNRARSHSRMVSELVWCLHQPLSQFLHLRM